jgi:hypothetical protein
VSEQLHTAICFSREHRRVYCTCWFGVDYSGCRELGSGSYGGIAIPAVHGVSSLLAWGSWFLSFDFGMEWLEGSGLIWRVERVLERERNRVLIGIGESGCTYS